MTESTLTVLGSGSILPRRGHGCSGYAVRAAGRGGTVLLDCGPGTLRSLAEAGGALGDVELVLLSHYHPDHCLDLLALAFARRNPAFTAGHLAVLGPIGLERVLAGGEAAFGRWTTFEDADLVEVDPAGGELEGDGTAPALRWAPTGHSPESIAWRLELAGGATLAYSGDSAEHPAVAELARGVDLFVCECAFPRDEGPDARHLSPRAAGRLAARSGCSRLLLTHYYPDVDPEVALREATEEYGGEVLAAHDGLQVTFGPAAGRSTP